MQTSIEPMISRTFDKVKAVNSLIFIANKVANEQGIADKYTALKILYFAEVKHLIKYGRLITDDTIARLEHGSTPSSSYNLLKEKNSDGIFHIISNTTFKPNQELDIEELSESDIECLSQAIAENKDLNFSQLKSKAHDKAYNKAEKLNENFVDLQYIFEQENLSESQIRFITESYEFKRLTQCLPL
ncbi:MAG: Panacea domain-containing protein [Mucilaginibacter sp.]|uniref:Panacea domain-containing protein n=1 Tax=Mucilaginibacter sp. TaxID=1882438 RepID=UPI0034E53F64